MELKTQTRTILGKRTKHLRNDGAIPAEVFGRGFENRHISVSAKEFFRVFKEAGENTVITLVNEKGERTPVVVSDVALDRIGGTALSVDFHHIRLDEKIQAKVPIEFIGDAPATKKGLILIKVLNEIEVEALPNKIPHRFEVNVAGLTDAGREIFVNDLKADRDVKIVTHGDSVIITVAETPKEKEEAPAPAAAPEASAPAEAAAAKNPSEEKPEAKK